VLDMANHIRKGDVMDRKDKFERFKALHLRDKAFVMPNPWDAGSARLLSSLGFEALATTSAGYAFSVGKRDSFAGLDRDEILENAARIADATALPVSGDLEDGFGPDPATCAETIIMACDIGLVGGSIEDATGDPEAPRERPFLLTARAENFLWGRPDLGDTIARLQAFSEAGADVLYAPGLPDIEAIRTLCHEVDKPVNVVMGLSGKAYSVDELSRAGVRRISVGGSFARAALGALMRAALGALMRAAEEVRTSRTLTPADEARPGAEITRLMAQDRHDNRA
jgi:2-methylisocitrate lyase-like PEP mutase family enzyme